MMLVFVATSTAVVVQAGAAAALTLVSDARIVRVKDPTCYNPPTCFYVYWSNSPSAPFAPFNSSIAQFDGTASQNTTVSTTAMSGTVSASATGGFGDGGPVSDSTSEITFDATAAVSYSLTGTGTGSYNASLVDVTTNTTLYSAFSPPLTSSGTLTSGHRYRVAVSALTFGPGESSNWTFSFSTGAPANPVPLDARPAALLLLVGLLVGARRWARARATA